MSDDMIALSRRAVACKGWRWMPGMTTVQGERVVRMDDDGTLRLAAPWGGTVGATAVRSFFDSSGACLPDLTDAATLGCLLALVREAWGSPGFYTARGDVRIKDTDRLGWDFFGYLRGKSCKGMLYRSEAEALVAALESAP